MGKNPRGKFQRQKRVNDLKALTSILMRPRSKRVGWDFRDQDKDVYNVFIKNL